MFEFILNSILILCMERTYNFLGCAMRGALRVSTKLTSSYDDCYTKFNPALFSRSCNFEDASAFHSCFSFELEHSFIQTQTILFEPRIARRDIECLVNFSCFQHVNITPFAFTRSIGDMLLLFVMPYLSKLETC